MAAAVIAERRRRRFWACIVFLTGVCVVTAILFGTTLQEEPAKRGAAVPQAPPAPPPVTYIDTDGLLVVFERAKANVLVVNFWATWCPPCVEETPELIEFYRRYHAKGVAFVSVSADHPDTVRERLAPFMEKHKIPYPVYVFTETSPKQLAHELALDWTGGLPATLVFDRQGALQKQWYEEVTASELAAVVEPLL